MNNFSSFHEWPQWVSALILLSVGLFLFFGKRILLKFLQRWSAKTTQIWDDFIIEALQRPLTFVIFAGVGSFIPVVFNLPGRFKGAVSLGSKLLIVMALALFVQKILLGLHNQYAKRQEALKTYAGLTRVMISIGVYSIFILIFLDTAGISITPILASLGVGSIAIALALQDTLSNVFSGVYLIVDKPLRVGDFVRLESGEEGSVDSIGWRSVRIRMPSNNTVIIPNSKLAGSLITNYDLPEKELALSVPIGVDYASDLEKVERVTIEVGEEVMKTVVGGVPDFKPSVRFQTFADSSINLIVALRGKEFADQYLIKHEFIKKLQKRYNTEGITFPFPTRTVHLVSEK
ncbi:MAG: mechanosensitive ion channel family protein [bacterium]|nr:mechanosensitive ion channel family protein [bacterium]